MADPLNASWIADSRALRNWFCAYVVLLAIGLYIWITRSATFDLSLGSYILLLSLVPYVVSIVYSYRIHKQLHASVRPATIETHHERTLTPDDHEPRPLPRAPTNILFLGGARPNGARLNCAA